MELLDLGEKELRERYAQQRADGGPSEQLRASVVLLLRFADANQKSEFANRCQSGPQSQSEFLDGAKDELCTLFILRGDVIRFFRRLDPAFEDEARYSRSPDEIHDQWKLVETPKPALLAAATIVENLKARNAADTQHAPEHLWIQHPPKALEGTEEDIAELDRLFNHWIARPPAAPGTAGTSAQRSGRTLSPLVTELLVQLGRHKNVILQGVAGSGKTHTLEALKDHYNHRTAVLVFHPSTSYEDFVVGLRPIGTGFSVVPGPFLVMCERALRDPGNDYLLFIDEINRANTARVLGDLLMVIEGSKRVDPKTLRTQGSHPGDSSYWTWRSEDYRSVLTDRELHDHGSISSVQLQTVLDGAQAGSGGRKHLVVPSNLHLLGTMNTTDRSVGTIDLALRRRFAWMNAEVLGGSELADQLGEERAGELKAVLDWHGKANQMLRGQVGPDAQLGHSYFFAHESAAYDVAEALVGQLAEVAHTFNFDEALIGALFGAGMPALPRGLRLHIHGRGLGRRFMAFPAMVADDG